MPFRPLSCTFDKIKQMVKIPKKITEPICREPCLCCSLFMFDLEQSKTTKQHIGSSETVVSYIV